jgi:uncharacterized protein YkwD
MSRRLPVTLAVLCAALVVAASGVAQPGARGAASVESSMQSVLIRLINASRADVGLRPLRADSRLGSLAVQRARWMAANRSLSHTSYGGSIGDAISAAGVRWMSAAEDIGQMSGPAGTSAAHGIFRLWRNSPPHWAAITSATFNYIGVGVALASAGTDPYAALVFAETRDRTPPIVRLAAGAVDGRTVSWAWTGADPLLQTHTSRLCSFDVDYRVGAGEWRPLRVATRTLSLTLAGRSPGRTYAIRVRATDCAGNVSGWTPARSITVP